jgi:phosphatidylserine/phosphatidylglycerophosphate/cardiolipin synthase-like enzyme
MAFGLVNCTPVSRSETPVGSADTWYAVYFSEPGNKRLEPYRGGPDAALVEAIKFARISVDMAADDFDLWNVRDVLIDAHRRGLTVRVVVDSDNISNPEIQDLMEAGIALSEDGRGGFMHDKFVIIDRAEVWTGSMNFTRNGAYRSDNNLIRISSPQLAQVYLDEFEEMFVEGLFGQGSNRDLLDPVISIDGTRLEAYFAPEDDVAERFLMLIREARESIYFLAYAFTDDDLAAALVEADTRGVEVVGIMDAAQARSNNGSDYAFFIKNGLDVHLDDRPGSMHHKVLIIDKNILVTGSYNFSSNARIRNDENTLIIYHKDIAEIYLREFQRILSETP